MTSGSFTGNTLGKGLIVDYQWDLAEAKSRRRLYLVIFFLNMFVTAGVAAAGSLIIAYLVHIVFVSIFMFLLLSLAKKLLSWSTATIVVLFIVIGFIPFASLLAVVIIDHRLYNIIKQRDKGLKSPTAPVPSQPVQLQEKQIEKKLCSIKKGLESGVEPEFILPIQDGNTAICIGCGQVAAKQQLFYCKEHDVYVHQLQECFDKLNSKIEGIN